MTLKKAYSILLICLLLTAAFSGCAGSEESKALKSIGSKLNLDLSEGNIITDKDTHGGFHGDGTTFIAVQFQDGRLAESLKSSDNWKPFPLSQNIYALMYGYDFGHLIAGPYLTDEETHTELFPKIENGYYLFNDRQAEETAYDIETNFFDRASWNFDLAVYDSDTDTLYYSKFDT